MAKHISKLKEYLYNFGNGVELNKKNVDDCLNEIRDVLIGSAKGRPASLSASQTTMTDRQLWFVLNGFGSDTNKYHFKPFSKLKMLYSSVCEHILVLMFKEAGVNIDVSKTKMKVVIETPDGNEIVLSGSDDYMIDGEVVDCKMPSEEVFREKFKNAKSLMDKDVFGYIPQAAIYADGRKTKFKGWDVSCTSTGVVKHVSATGIDMKAVLDPLKERYDRVVKIKDVKDAHCKYNRIEEDNLIPWQCSKCRWLERCRGSDLELIERNKDGVVRHKKKD